MKTDKIYLVGFMAAGKTTLAQGLSRRLGWRAEDVDLLIEARERRSVAEIFAREARLDELHAALAQPEVLRSGDRVRAVKTEIGEQKEALERLYEHWNEATELN